MYANGQQLTAHKAISSGPWTWVFSSTCFAMLPQGEAVAAAESYCLPICPLLPTD